MKLIGALVIYVANHYIDVLPCDNWSNVFSWFMKKYIIPRLLRALHVKC